MRGSTLRVEKGTENCHTRFDYDLGEKDVLEKLTLTVAPSVGRHLAGRRRRGRAARPVVFRHLKHGVPALVEVRSVRAQDCVLEED